jgi:hypothetical protein
MGMVWHNDPKHSIIFYKEFWTENALVFSTPPKHAWAYVMSEVIIKIESASTMLLCIVGALVVCCGGCGAGYNYWDNRDAEKMRGVQKNCKIIGGNSVLNV